jgi:outer membrane protein assembly factor BamE (lipoprotein component of BamABCDE complex)
MERLSALALAAAALAVLPSCLISRDTQNEPLSVEALAGLTPGSTTAAQAVELLGAPSEIVQLGFRSAYRYEFGTAKRAALFLIVVNLSNTDARSDRLWLFFDDGDVLTHVASSFEAADARYKMPWQKHP